MEQRRGMHRRQWNPAIILRAAMLLRRTAFGEPTRHVEGDAHCFQGEQAGDVVLHQEVSFFSHLVQYST